MAGLSIYLCISSDARINTCFFSKTIRVLMVVTLINRFSLLDNHML